MRRKYEKEVFFNTLVFKLIVGLVAGILVGSIASAEVIVVIDAIKSILSNLISYIVPMIILGFITPAIVSLKDNAGKILSTTLIICYVSSVGVALLV